MRFQKKQNLIGKELLHSKNDYGDAGIVYALFVSAKIKFCILLKDNGLLQQKVTFKGCDREISQIGFEYFLKLEKGLIVRITSKLNWKRDLLDVKVPHRVMNCENCQNDKMCRSCIIAPKLICFDFDISRSCDKCLRTTTQIRSYSTEINKLNREPPDEIGYMLHHYVGEKIVEEEERDQTQVSYGKGNKCFLEMNHDNYIKNRKICRGCYNQNKRKQFRV